jgi:hypothetical protein
VYFPYGVRGTTGHMKSSQKKPVETIALLSLAWFTDMGKCKVYAKD